MSFQITFDSEAVEFLESIPKDIKERIFNKIISTKNNPFRFFERLEGRTDFKLRIGDYRAIADIHRSEMKIEVTRIGHRKNIYKNI
ncbi:MAG TPA: type II toxin-antitoxin system RelE/ParE family toxin [Candidatus Nanoarchaeia archaeon]|nr:type II toxin-antitoxin system RelE/ParE family toxin [Candidatus Nanoarchaeia archaeon]